jgi:hypothetical protein
VALLGERHVLSRVPDERLLDLGRARTRTNLIDASAGHHVAAEEERHTMSYASVWTAATWREVCMIHAGGWSLILCRNVAFTYFNEAVQREVLSRIVARLRAGEFLVIGRHERPPTWRSPMRRAASTMSSSLRAKTTCRLQNSPAVMIPPFFHIGCSPAVHPPASTAS